MNFFSSLETSASGLTAPRLRMDVISSNIANVSTTRTPQGGPYQRQRVVFEPRQEAQFLLPTDPGQRHQAQVGKGVRVAGLSPDPRPARLVYDPGHPDANPDGYVAMPNINIVNEMVDMMSATRAYEANVAAISAARSMAQSALDIGRG